MKLLFILLVFPSILVGPLAQARTVEIDVHGMTCAFCVDSLERKFKKLNSVSKFEISLKHNKVRLETDDTQPSIEKIKKTILDAGFTPVKVLVRPDEN